jgi:hypothetical protein
MLWYADTGSGRARVCSHDPVPYLRSWRRHYWYVGARMRRAWDPFIAPDDPEYYGTMVSGGEAESTLPICGTQRSC